MMDKITDEVLVAYADDELTEQERTALKARIAADPELAERTAVFLNTGRAALSELYDPSLSAPVPDHLRAAVLDGPTQSTSAKHVIPPWWHRLRLSQSIEEALTSAFGLRPAVALSLTLAVAGIAGWIGYMAMPTRAPVGTVADAAHGGVFAALETQAAGRSVSIDTSDRSDSVLKVLLTFQSRNGEFCREYHLSDTSGSSAVGVACRKAHGGWQVVVLAPLGRQTLTDGKVTTASRPKQRDVDAVVDDLIVGDVLTLEQEAALISRRWQAAP